MDNVFALDIETRTLDESNPQFALEPFRLKQGLAEITSVDVSGPDGYLRQLEPVQSDELHAMLTYLADTKRPVACHNTVFDTAWMLLLVDDFELIERVNWHDTGLLAKWAVNSQWSDMGGLSFSLVGLCKHFLSDHPRLAAFVEMKEKGNDKVAGEDAEYWSERGSFDAFMTRELFIKLRSILPASQRNGYGIEQQCIPYVARAWVEGIDIDEEYLETLPPKAKAVMKSLEKETNLPGSLMRSATQLSDYLFVTCGMTPLNYGKHNAKLGRARGSVASGDLKRLRIQCGDTAMGRMLGKILDYKQLATLESKYLNGLRDAMIYTGENKIYTAPRIFGTYTGRFTYSSKTLKKDAFKTSIATHQLPRVGPTKRCIKCPEGMWIIKCDGAQQELRLIGVVSGDNNLLSEFRAGIDVHSSMSAFIANESYDDFMHRLHVEKCAEAKNYRYAGKLLNLSCQYRIGATALMNKFFETYGIIISRNDAYFYLNIYKQRYPGVIDYWDTVVKESREAGFTHTLADRRFYLTDWQEYKWQTESSAINFPIQGSAADHKELTMMIISKKYPEIRFFLDIHDELCFYTPQSRELVMAVAHDIANLSDLYRAHWNKDIPIDLPFDTKLCVSNFKDSEDIEI